MLVISVLYTFHAIEVICLISVYSLFVIFEEKFESNEMFIPTSSGDINLNFAYPITLSGTKCYPADLASCNDSSSSTCCKLAYDISIYPFQHLTGFQTLLLVIFVPIIYIVIRTLVWMLQSDRLTVRNVIPNGSPRTFPYIYWCLIIWENIIGLIITLLFEEIITISFKSMVGEPRPIFYSLKYWSEIHKTLRYDFFTNCYKSFPSGHSSSAAAGFGYIACIGFNDSLVFFRKMPLLSRISFMLAVCSVTFALWVGASRIIDYWHFQWDVLAGLSIGFFSAYLGQLYISMYEGIKSFYKLQNILMENVTSIINDRVELFSSSSYPYPYPYTLASVHESPLSNNPNSNLDFETGFAWTPDRNSNSSTRHMSSDIVSPQMTSPIPNVIQKAKLRMRAGLENIRKQRMKGDHATNRNSDMFQGHRDPQDDFEDADDGLYSDDDIEKSQHQ